jgi:SSS family solute:Na+ symporter
LYPVGKMVYVTTPFSLEACIIGIGILIVVYTAAGGLWAVLVTDVVQFVILTASVLIVLPIAFKQVGGIQAFISNAPDDFFKPFNNEYTFEFMLAFIVYQTVYIGGNWSYVQRYTSVKDQRNSKKVAYTFTILYFISPFLWMLPPMIYRIINPNLTGLESEGAYMMLCQRILPTGLIGLVLAGMISATSSKANTTINLAATVFSTDLYKNLIRKSASDKELILVARLFTLVFGAITIVIALLVPKIGGIVDFVLAIASIAGGALFAPIIWSLFSKRQTGFSIVTTSSVALLVNLFFKALAPSLLHIKLSRTYETILGEGIPVLMLLIFELYYISKSKIAKNAFAFKNLPDKEVNLFGQHHIEAEKQNAFGIKVIGISIALVSMGIIALGIISDRYAQEVIVVGIIILFSSVIISLLAYRKQAKIKFAENAQIGSTSFKVNN